jgi:ribosomal protein L19E
VYNIISRSNLSKREKKEQQKITSVSGKREGATEERFDPIGMYIQRDVKHIEAITRE